MTTEKNAKSKPSHRLYQVAGEGKNAIWTPVAAAWPHRDGKGFNIVLEALPVSGRITLRVYQPKPKAA